VSGFTIGAGQSITSDFVTITGNPIVSTSDLVVIFDVASSNGNLSVLPPGAVTKATFKSSTSSYNSTSSSGFTDGSTVGFLIAEVDGVLSTNTYVTGQEINVASVGGTTEANGSWIITVIDGSTIDLQGSTFTNAYVSGGTVTAQPGFAILPTDFLTWRRVTWTGSPRTELGYVHPSYLQAAYPSQPADVPRIFTIEGSTLKVMPLSGTPLEFDYYQAIPSLVSASTNWLMTAHPDLYLFGSMCEAEAFGVNDERMPMWKARRDEIFEEIIMRDRQTRGPSYVRVFGATP
jgi:hypothetical protein